MIEEKGRLLTVGDSTAAIYPKLRWLGTDPPGDAITRFDESICSDIFISCTPNFMKRLQQNLRKFRKCVDDKYGYKHSILAGRGGYFGSPFITCAQSVFPATPQNTTSLNDCGCKPAPKR
jgi:hypothetical protein